MSDALIAVIVTIEDATTILSMAIIHSVLAIRGEGKSESKDKAQVFPTDMFDFFVGSNKSSVQSGSRGQVVDCLYECEVPVICGLHASTPLHPGLRVYVGVLYDSYH